MPIEKNKADRSTGGTVATPAAVPPHRPVGIKDIAAASGASPTTVSLVLNARGQRISPETRRRVLEAAKRLRYRPNRLAQGLQSQRSGILAILLPEIQHAFADVYFGELISAIHDRASEADQKILLEVAHPRFIELGRHRELFERRFVDGVLCMGVTNHDVYLRDFPAGRYPVIVVNNHLPEIGLSYVCCDYRRAGRLAVEHLVGMGHREIGLIHGAPEVQTSRDFQTGVCEALAATGLSLPPTQMEDGLYTTEGGAAAAAAILFRAPGVTALVAGNDKMAIGAISRLKALGRSVPGDVSVIGCDDIPQGAYCDPPLTTIRTPLYELGRRACQALMELIEGKAERVEEVMAVGLTERKSVARLRGG